MVSSVRPSTHLLPKERVAEAPSEVAVAEAKGLEKGVRKVRQAKGVMAKEPRSQRKSGVK